MCDIIGTTGDAAQQQPKNIHLGLSGPHRGRILFVKNMQRSLQGRIGAPNVRRLFLPLFFLVYLLLSQAAWCEPGESGLEAIRSQMDQGQGLFLAKKYEEAAEVFEAGYQKHPYSAFLFNAGVCYQKLGRADAALDAFQRYLAKDPNAPDAAAVRERMAGISQAKSAAEAAESEAEEGAEGPQAIDLPDDPGQGMKSLVIIESEPPGAPVKVYRRRLDSAPEFVEGATNDLWQLVTERATPLNLTLDVGRYHIVIEEFQEYNRTNSNLDVSPGHVHHFKANLSQGEFTGLLEVTTNVVGANLYLDDDGKKRTLWGKAPHGALISPGEHTLLVEAPGYKSVEHRVEVQMGDKESVEIELQRVEFGVLRLDADVGEVTLSVDGKPVGAWRQGQDAIEVELPAGSHDLLVSAKGYKDLRKLVTIPQGQILPMRARMVEKFPRGAAWTQAVLAAGFVGAGVYFGVESNRLNRELTEDRDAGYLHAEDPRIRRGFWYSIGADSGFAVGGILGILSTYNFLRDPYPDPILQLGKQRDFKRHRTGPESPGRGALSSRPFGLEFATSRTHGGAK